MPLTWSRIGEHFSSMWPLYLTLIVMGGCGSLIYHDEIKYDRICAPKKHVAQFSTKDGGFIVCQGEPGSFEIKPDK